MVKKIRVSRQGLTRCPSCKNHIKVADPINKTICSFCETSLAESFGTATGEVILGTRMVAGGSRAVLAAAILGLPLAACGTMVPVSEDIVVDAGNPDPGNQPAYGVPMDWMDPPVDEAGNIDVDPAPDENFMPEYGLPPEDAGFGEDAVPDVVESDEGLPVPLYGISPPEDAGSTEDDGADVEESDDVPNMALYGLPPDDKEPGGNPS
jgi:hypothetical protein